MELLVRRLILISVAPPTSRNYDAQILLGMLASYAFEPMRDRLESQLRYSPMAFRVWRAITKLVRLSEGGEHAEALRVWVRRLMRDAEELRKHSLYAGSSLDLELAITVPAAWSPPEDDWVGEALRARAREQRGHDPGTRHGGHGAVAARARPRADPTWKRPREDLRELITEFRDPETRPDARRRAAVAGGNARACHRQPGGGMQRLARRRRALVPACSGGGRANSTTTGSRTTFLPGPRTCSGT